MIFQSVKRRDKTGQEIMLRNAVPEDAQSLLNFLKLTAAETPYLIREPDEVKLSLEQEQNFIRQMLEGDRELLLVATLDGKHIGNCSLRGLGEYQRYRHRCDVAIALYQEYCKRGIGRMMLEAVLETARELGYEQAELEVIADNENALALYERLGFLRYGHFPNNMKYKNGAYADAYWMMKKL